MLHPVNHNAVKLKIHQTVEARLRYHTFPNVPDFDNRKEELKTEIYQQIHEEKEGKRKSFFTAKKGIDRALGICCSRRIRSFRKEQWLQEIHARPALEDYEIYFEGELDQHAGLAKGNWIAARCENVSFRFGEPMDGYNRTPDEVYEYNYLLSIFRKEHQAMLSKGKDGPKLFMVIEFFLHEYDEGMSKKEMITTLSQYLKEDRKRTRELKCRALKLLLLGIEKYVDLKETKNIIDNKKNLASRFRKISDKNLLASHARAPKNGFDTLKSSIEDYTQEEIEAITRNPSCFLDYRGHSN